MRHAVPLNFKEPAQDSPKQLNSRDQAVPHHSAFFFFAFHKRDCKATDWLKLQKTSRLISVNHKLNCIFHELNSCVLPCCLLPIMNSVQFEYNYLSGKRKFRGKLFVIQGLSPYIFKALQEQIFP